MTEATSTIFTPEETESKQQDYFGFDRTERYMLPDGKSWIEFKPLNEGKKKNFQDKTTKDLVLERRSGDARMSVAQGSERHELIKASVVGWNLKRGGQDLPQPDPDNPRAPGSIQLNDFLTLADPVIIEGLEKEIRKANPWLLQDMKPEDIEKQIEELQEMLEVAKKREEGEAS